MSGRWTLFSIIRCEKNSSSTAAVVTPQSLGHHHRHRHHHSHLPVSSEQQQKLQQQEEKQRQQRRLILILMDVCGLFSLLVLGIVLSTTWSVTSSSSIEAPEVPRADRMTTGRSAFLRREMLQNSSVTCNDGTAAGFYIRTNPSSKRWLLFLEGGWYCFSEASCHQRWIRARALMTSTHWPQIRSMGGIFSLNPDENPYWSDANHVLVPYCSSDFWSGDVAAKNPGDFSFLGSRIVEQVIIELLQHGLQNAELLLLAGSSAGAGGVLVNLDRVADLMQRLAPMVQVQGLADSGWFLDNKPFDGHYTKNLLLNSCQTSPHNCPPIDAMKLAIKHWNGQVPESCLAQHASEPWRCFFGYRIYQTLKSPLFVVQWMFDEAQMTVNYVNNPVTKAQMNYLHRLGMDLRRSLANVTALFAPSCVSHTIITKRSWIDTKVNRVSLPDALHCWEQETMAHKYSIVSKPAAPEVTIGVESVDLWSSTPAVTQSSSSQVPYEKMLITNSASVGSGSIDDRDRGVDITIPTTIRNRKRKRKRKHRQQHRHNHHYHHKNRRDPEQRFRHDNRICRFRLIDHCSWPQCNKACPRLFNPFTGKETDFSELLKTLGLNTGDVSHADASDKSPLNRLHPDPLLHFWNQ